MMFLIYSTLWWLKGPRRFFRISKKISGPFLPLSNNLSSDGVDFIVSRPKDSKSDEIVLKKLELILTKYLLIYLVSSLLH